MTPDIQTLLDREAIRDCVARLARGEDRRSADLIRSCWWPEARFDYGVYAGDFDAYLAWVVPGADAIKDTQHLIGQSVIELDGDSARVESHVFSYHRVDMGREIATPASAAATSTRSRSATGNGALPTG